MNSGTLSKIKLRLVVPLLALLFLSTIDRSNVSFAALRMNADLALTPQTYGFGVSLFFVGYIVMQIPSMWLLQRFGMRRWLVGITLVWGLAATGMAFMHSREAFYVLRVVLGIAEAGYAPGMMFYLAGWIPQRYRAGAIANVMLAVPISVVIGAPLSGWLMSIENPLGLAGWRWMLLIEGAPTLLLCLATWWLFADTPQEARWLSPAERRWIEDELKRERASRAPQASLWSLLGRSELWGSTACWFALMAGAYGLIYWLPQIVKHFSATSSDLRVGVISALPWAAIGVGMLLNAWHSDRTQERYLHVALTSLLSGVLLGLAAIAGGGGVALLCLVLSGLCMGAGQGVFWTIPPSFLAPASVAGGFAIINMCGNVAGLVVPSAIGAIRERTGSFDLPVFAIAAILLAGALALLKVRSTRERVADGVRSAI